MNTISNILRETNKYHNVNKINITNVNNVGYKAQRLVERLGDEHSRLFYYKVASRLPESVIENYLEQALKGHSPPKYFTWLCQRALQNYGNVQTNSGNTP